MLRTIILFSCLYCSLSISGQSIVKADTITQSTKRFHQWGIHLNYSNYIGQISDPDVEVGKSTHRSLTDYTNSAGFGFSYTNSKPIENSPTLQLDIEFKTHIKRGFISYRKLGGKYSSSSGNVRGENRFQYDYTNIYLSNAYKLNFLNVFDSGINFFTGAQIGALLFNENFGIMDSNLVDLSEQPVTLDFQNSIVMKNYDVEMNDVQLGIPIGISNTISTENYQMRIEASTEIPIFSMHTAGGLKAYPIELGFKVQI